MPHDHASYGPVFEHLVVFAIAALILALLAMFLGAFREWAQERKMIREFQEDLDVIEAHEADFETSEQNMRQQHGF